MKYEYPPLLVLRHGETEWNASGRLHGGFDSPLTERGIRQAQAQHAVLAALDLGGYRAFCSPQGRALRTAAIALDGLAPAIETDARLAEIGVGDWAGCYLRDLPVSAKDPAAGFAVYENAPGGEGLSALRVRCREFLGSLAGPSVVVSHGITALMLRMIALHREPGRFQTVPDQQGVVYRIERGCQTVLGIGT